MPTKPDSTTMIRIIVVLLLKSAPYMSQVSKYPLSRDTELKLYKLFWETIANLNNSLKAEQFFTDLLTPTEKVMLSKRLAIAVMLIRGHDYWSIRHILKVSPSTIGSISLWLKYSGKGYRKAVEEFMRREKIANILDSLESTLELIKPEKTFGRVLAKGFPEGKSRTPF